MRRGQFNSQRDVYIESFFVEFCSLLDGGLQGKKLTTWKQQTATAIMDDPRFANLDTKFTRKEYHERIVRKFGNYRNHVYLKQNPDSPTVQPPPSKGLPLLKFSSVLTDRQLFAQENNADITSTSAGRAAQTSHGRVNAVYQTVLKEMWDALSDGEKNMWDAKADEGAGDVERNQTEFRIGVHSALTDLCRGGLIGNAEIIMFYGFRNPSSGDLNVGSIHARCAHNKVNFGGTREQLQENYGAPWATFVESVIPRPANTDSEIIPRNALGVPVFPSIDLNSITPADTRLLLGEYWSQAWAHARPANTVIPWADIEDLPSKFYDTIQFSLPLPLGNPLKLNTLETTIWAEFLVRTSSIFAEKPFVFCAQESQPVNRSPQQVGEDEYMEGSFTTTSMRPALNDEAQNPLTRSVGGSTAGVDIHPKLAAENGAPKALVVTHIPPNMANTLPNTDPISPNETSENIDTDEEGPNKRVK
ncbi:hypothetical protein C8J57DRAFT_1530053 [Mycena rebaudengoi]|nr:hypothetical protein C8J57DRAFT_1530053 [Mycena rebaudengoi]